MNESGQLFMPAEAFPGNQTSSEFDTYLQLLKEHEAIEFPFEMPKDLKSQNDSKLEQEQPQFPPFNPFPPQFAFQEPIMVDTSSSPSSGPIVGDDQPYMTYVSSNVVPNFSEPTADPVDELLQRMSWHSDEKSKAQQKRKREVNATKESQQEKHKSAERKRRSDINEYIEGMKTMLPSYRLHGEKAGKMTKLQVLTEAHEYLVALQDYGVHLMTENKMLRDRLSKYEDISSPEHTPGSSSSDESSPTLEPKRSRPNNAPRNILFAFMTLLVVTLVTPTNLFLSGGDESPAARSLLSLTFHSIPSLQPFIPVPALPSWLWWTLGWLFATFFMYITLFLSFESVVDLTDPNFQDGKEQMRIGGANLMKGKSGIHVLVYFKRALDLFSRGAVNSSFLSFFLLHWELFRMLMHAFRIGIILDDILFYLKGGTPEFLSHVIVAQARIIKSYPTMPHVQWVYAVLNGINNSDLLVHISQNAGQAWMTGGKQYPEKDTESFLNIVLEHYMISLLRFRTSNHKFIRFLSKYFEFLVSRVIRNRKEFSFLNLKNKIDCGDEQKVFDEVKQKIETILADSPGEDEADFNALNSYNNESLRLLVAMLAQREMIQGRTKNARKYMETVRSLASKDSQLTIVQPTSHPLALPDTMSSRFFMSKSPALLGSLLLLEGESEAALAEFSQFAKTALKEKSFTSFQFGNLGALTALIELKRYEQLDLVWEYYHKVLFSHFRGTKKNGEKNDLENVFKVMRHEDPFSFSLYIVLRMYYFVAKKDVTEVFKLADRYLLSMFEKVETTWMIWMLAPLATALHVAVWLYEDAQSETSSLIPHKTKICQMVLKLHSYVELVSKSFVVIRPKIWMIMGRFHLASKNYVEAKWLWTQAMNLGAKLDLQKDVKAAQALLEQNPELNTVPLKQNPTCTFLNVVCKPSALE